MIGIKVKHISLGIGTIIAYENDRLTVEFATQTSKFIYPDAFNGFLKAVDPDVQEKIINSINEAKAAAEQKRLAEEAARKAEDERLAAEEAARRAIITRNTTSRPRPAVRTQRIAGKRMTFFVFQGNTFEKECRGGYIWAPIYDRSGSQPHHWTRLLDVRKGDIILHNCDGYVQAISIAKDVCYDSPQPVELTTEDLWEKDGRRIDCEYIRINRPIKTSRFTADIIRLSNVKYSPFDKYGSGNMGYLFELNRELARIFVAASVKQNPSLGAVDYIQELLAEADLD